jgi:hypothetical protein
LTEDPCVAGWAEHRQGAARLTFVELQPQRIPIT